MDFRFVGAAAASLTLVLAASYFLLRGPSGKKMSAAPEDEVLSHESRVDKAGKPIDSKHYAWAKDIKRRADELAALGVDMTPKPVAVVAAPAPSAPAAPGSAWNAAGTWEDRDVSAKALQLLRGALERFSFTSSGGVVSCASVTSCTGTATVIFVRGRVKPGYECQAVLQWELRPLAGADGAAAPDPIAEGQLTLTDISDSEADVWGDAAVSVSREAAGAAGGAKRAVLASLEHLRSALRAWVDELRKL